MTERSGPDPAPERAPNPHPEPDFDAIVLAGGAADRLGGVDKPLLRIGERTLLDGVLAACAGARRTVVVGPTRAVSREVTWVREQPPGAGPAAALAAGLALCDQPQVIVLAADLPFIDASVIHSLWTASVQQPADGAAAIDGAIAVDESGRHQWLTACYRRASLITRISELQAGDLVGLSLRRLLGGLRLSQVETPSQVTFDCDTWDEVAAARSLEEAAQAEQPQPE